MEEVRDIVRSVVLEIIESHSYSISNLKGVDPAVKWNTIPFGKFAGKLFKDVPDNYLRWITTAIIKKGENKRLLRNILEYYAGKGFLKWQEIENALTSNKIPTFLEERPYKVNANVFAFRSNAQINNKLLFLGYYNYKLIFSAKNGGILECHVNSFNKKFKDNAPMLKKGTFYTILGKVVKKQIVNTEKGPMKTIVFDIEDVII